MCRVAIEVTVQAPSTLGQAAAGLRICHAAHSSAGHGLATSATDPGTASLVKSRPGPSWAGHFYVTLPVPHAGVIARVPVESSHLASVGHDGDALLEIEFTDGSVYESYGVPASVYHGLLGAASRGKYFEAHVRGRFDYRRVA